MGEGVFMILMNCICIDVVVYPVEKAEMVFSFSFYFLSSSERRRFFVRGFIILLSVSFLQRMVG